MSQNFDMINLLPTSLLIIIISLLPFKEAARTSILAKNWMHLWKSTTNVEFNEHHFSRSNEFQRNDFLKFITLWIENHHQNCDEEYDEPEALFELPTKVYEHKALESIKLFSCGFVATKLIKLHSLKEVSFGWMELKNEAIKILLCNCKKIESLSIKNCWMSTNFECGGSDLSLKTLIIDSCKFYYPRLTINAPNLSYFKYYGNVAYFKIQNSLHMNEVDINFGLEYQYPKVDEFIHKVITDFKHVKVLTVCSFILQVLSNALGPLLVEDKLNTRHLKLMTSLHNNEYLGVLFLLNGCPMLELLTFDLGFGRFLDVIEDEYSSDGDGDGDGDDDDDSSYVGDENQIGFIDYKNICQCLKSSLKVVEINNFTGAKNQILMLKFLIYNGSLIQRITINVSKEGVVNVENYHKIKECVMTIRPRASTDLEIFFFLKN
ncbi:putative F-box/LRR-repeat protein At5g54820 [Trifolium pratense]|uniref:putative F-box/LRR-repeat protein At5g54820 n=1 Tax=Trifolium pratense TaxID=57577 RepID=UPI001E6907E3|nr:putative F-box/LRR-repeat protein At5g54820 [Trifolium pratense]